MPAAAEGESVLLCLENVTKRWNTQLVLDEIALELRAGVITGVVGDNGVGKTTLLRCAAGMIIPDGGADAFPRRRHRA